MLNENLFFEDTKGISIFNEEIKNTENETRFLNDAAIAHLFSVRSASYAAKEIIYHECETVDAVYLVRRGIVKLVSHLPNGRARIVRVHSTGAWLGLGGLLGQPYEHTAIAVDDVDVYRISVSEMLSIKSENPHLYCQLIEHWFEYLKDADLWIAQLSTGAIKGRVARLVNYLSGLESLSSSNEVKLLTCEEMAEILGVTPESVSRVLAEFKRDKVLSPCIETYPKSRVCYLLNQSALNSIAEH